MWQPAKNASVGAVEPSLTTTGENPCFLVVTCSNLAFTADGKRLAFATSGNKTRQWDVSTNNEIQKPNGHPGAVLTTFLSADGSTALTRSFDNNLHVWDARSGKELRHFELPAVAFVSIANDNRTMALGAANGTIHIWDLHAGKEVRRWQPEGNDWRGLLGLSLSPDGKSLVSRNGKFISQWDVATGEKRRQLTEA